MARAGKHRCDTCSASFKTFAAKRIHEGRAHKKKAIGKTSKEEEAGVDVVGGLASHMRMQADQVQKRAEDLAAKLVEQAKIKAESIRSMADQLEGK